MKCVYRENDRVTFNAKYKKGKDGHPLNVLRILYQTFKKSVPFRITDHCTFMCISNNKIFKSKLITYIILDCLYDDVIELNIEFDSHVDTR